MQSVYSGQWKKCNLLISTLFQNVKTKPTYSTHCLYGDTNYRDIDNAGNRASQLESPKEENMMKQEAPYTVEIEYIEIDKGMMRKALKRMKTNNT